MPKYRTHLNSHISCSVKVWHNIQWPILVPVPFPHKFCLNKPSRAYARFQQDCIPVGCILPASWPYLPAGTALGGGMLQGGGLVRGGMSGLEGAWSRGGAWSGGWCAVSHHALRQTPPWTEWQTGAKTSFAGGKYYSSHRYDIKKNYTNFMRVVLTKFLTRKLPGNVGKECLNCYLTEFYWNCRRH